MKLEELKKRFIVDEDVIKARLESVLEKALNHCVVDKSGIVHINNAKMSGKNKVKLVLSARYLAAQLIPEISATVTSGDISKSTGLPLDQVHARSNEVLKSKFAESPRQGEYRALPHKIEEFLDEIARNTQ